MLKPITTHTHTHTHHPHTRGSSFSAHLVSCTQKMSGFSWSRYCNPSFYYVEWYTNKLYTHILLPLTMLWCHSHSRNWFLWLEICNVSTLKQMKHWDANVAPSLMVGIIWIKLSVKSTASVSMVGKVLSLRAHPYITCLVHVWWVNILLWWHYTT